MAFPQTVLPIKQEMLIDGTWTDVTSDVQQSAGVSITRGSSNEQTNTSSSSSEFTLKNTSNKYSNRNPNSIYYGLLPRNTQCRTSVTDTLAHLLLRDNEDGASAYTVDKAALDIVGDIDIRIDIEPDLWVNNGINQILAAKYRNDSTPNQKSWLFAIEDDGRPVFIWWRDGTESTVHARRCSALVPSTSGRLALRVTLQVNVAGSNLTKFYTSDSISGTWTQLGATDTVAAVESIFSGSADLQVGNGDDLGVHNDVYLTYYPFVGRIHSFELYSGVAGSLVAKADFTAQAEGATTWSDGLGNTWLTTATAAVTKARYRFWGEISSFPQTADSTGRYATVPVTASDVIRRVGQSGIPVRSPIYASLTTKSPTGYWPMEDGSGATIAASAVSAGNPASILDCTFGSDSTLGGSKGALEFGGTEPYVSGVANVTADGTLANFIAYFKFSITPASEQTLFTIAGNGRVVKWQFTVSATNYKIYGFDVGGATVVSTTTTFGAGAEPTSWIALNIKISTSGGNTLQEIAWHTVGTTISYVMGSTLYAGTTGRFVSWSSQGVSALDGAKIAHVYLSQTAVSFGTTEFDSISSGFSGETAGARFLRICDTIGVTGYLIGAVESTALMGVQPIATAISILQDIADTDHGVIYSPRNALAITYRSRVSLYAQYGPELTYSSFHFSGQFDSTDDDQNIENDVTASRPDGASARSEITTGPLSVNDAPAGAGRYDKSKSVNTELDTNLLAHAQWFTFLGTWDEARYPTVTTELHRSVFSTSASLTLGVERLDVGSYFKVKSLPQRISVDDVLLVVRGTRERLSARTREISFNASPYGPYAANLTSDTFELLAQPSGASTLATSYNTTDTSFSVATAAGSALWVTGATSLPAKVAGELVTITNVTGASSPQTFTVTRSVNGVIKAQTSGAVLSLAAGQYAVL